MSKNYKIFLLFVCVVLVSNSCSKKEKLSGDYGPNSGGFDQLGFGTPLYTLE